MGLRYGERGIKEAMVSTEFAEGPGGIRLTSRRGSSRLLVVRQASGGCSVPRGRPIAELALALPHPDAGPPRRAAPAEHLQEKDTGCI